MDNRAGLAEKFTRGTADPFYRGANPLAGSISCFLIGLAHTFNTPVAEAVVALGVVMRSVWVVNLEQAYGRDTFV